VGKRKRKRDKKPVLTSPWKIGVLVALMLSATSFGVGYYMVKVYNIDLYWLSSDVSRWGVDSYQFFREIYPAAAGVLLLALFTYFVIASAVRRYRYYLNSGQDYRKMISIADSIDDLTNPAQIARLSEYPELQDVLRNYGDQIREISEGMESREEEMRSVDLEVEIDSILQGNGFNETLADGKWWASIARKIQAWTEENEGGSEDLRKQSEAARQAVGRASLSCGRVVETASSAGDDILDIVRSVGQLNAVANGLGSGSPAADPSGNVSALQNAASDLERSSSTIRELSEESNGLALNMALMAARGEVTEKDLAELAEKVRSAAERFGKLGRELEDTSRTIAENSRGAGDPAGGSGDPEAGRGILEISEKIESRSRSLQQKLTSLGSDIEDISRALQPTGETTANEEDALDGEERVRNSDGSIVNFGAGENAAEEEVDDSELVINHGKLWEDSPESEHAPSEYNEEVGEDSGEFLISGFQDAMSAMKPGAAENAVEEEAGSVEEQPEAVEEPEPVIEESIEEPEAKEEYEIPPVEDSCEEQMEEAVAQQAEVTEADHVTNEVFAEEAAADQSWEEMQAQPEPQVEYEPEVESAPVEEPVAEEAPAVEAEVVPEPEAAAPVEEQASEAEEEPIYDLFELGAVEYAEETEVNL
jgi:methyl-accepting chemotaxis protein